MRDAGRMIGAVADAMSRAISPAPIEQNPTPWWRRTLQHLQKLSWRPVSTVRGQSYRLRVVRTLDESNPFRQQR